MTIMSSPFWCPTCGRKSRSEVCQHCATGPTPFDGLAVRAKTAQERARIAADIIKAGLCQARAFDDCFEMFDGPCVCRELARLMASDLGLYTKALRNWKPIPGLVFDLVRELRGEPKEKERAA